MLKRTSIEIALLACLVSGCTTPMGTTASTPVASESSAIWIQNPRAYAEEIAGSSDHERERLRQQALEEYLKLPGAQQQLHLNVVYDATVASLADANAASDGLTHALGDGSGLSSEARAVLTNLLVRIERRADDLKTIANHASEMATQRGAYQALERKQAAADAQHAATQKALREAQAKLEALKSIEQTLESNTPQPSGEAETKPEEKP
jgi:predicted RNA-binding protein YlxR (DUF448 family)